MVHIIFNTTPWKWGINHYKASVYRWVFNCKATVTMTTWRDWFRCALPSPHPYFFIFIFLIWEEGWADTILQYHITSGQSWLVFNKTENITKPSCNILRNKERIARISLKKNHFQPCYRLSETKWSFFFPGCVCYFIGDKNRPPLPYYRSDHTAETPVNFPTYPALETNEISFVLLHLLKNSLPCLLLLFILWE